jgi:plasmid stabilization system protein ParE
MPKSIIWSPLAESDFTCILEYLQDNWEEKVFQGFIELTEETLAQISNHPKQFPLIYKKKKVRKCVLTKHNTLYYRESKDSFDVLRIYDNRQDPVKLKF